MKISKYSFVVLFWLFYTLPLYAFPHDPESGENEDEQQASVDDWMFILMVMAIALAIYFTVRYKKKEVV